MNKRRAFNPLPELVVIFLILIIFWVLGAVFYYHVENLSVIDAIYLSAMTLTTVGYGDFTPQTDVGKIFTSVYALLGICVFFGFAGMAFAATLSQVQRRSQ
ncbi:MAG TPA: potassium channel family protein [Candidatus Saccharimonadales bacterium]|nr:potassium channel family protein [Candidatus Saccharimonadales bacterium]